MSHDLLKEALYYEQLSPALLLAVLGVAFLLGALHALGPGHGKSLMAAYLVGSQGRARDAVVLALTLTLSHVLVVVVVAFLALWVTDFFWPEKAAKWFGVGSGVAISAIGVWLLVARIKGIGKLRLVAVPRGHAEHATHRLNEALKHYSAGGHVHYHPDHGDHALPMVAPRHWRSTVSLGFSSGIVPCPKAMVILLLAISMHRIPLGLAIVTTFSAGMALVLMVLGLALVRASSLVHQRLEARGTAALALLGAIVVIALGAFVAIRALSAN